jgi:hypothetical protein
MAVHAVDAAAQAAAAPRCCCCFVYCTCWPCLCCAPDPHECTGYFASRRPANHGSNQRWPLAPDTNPHIADQHHLLARCQPPCGLAGTPPDPMARRGGMFVNKPMEYQEGSEPAVLGGAPAAAVSSKDQRMAELGFDDSDEPDYVSDGGGSAPASPAVSEPPPMDDERCRWQRRRVHWVPLGRAALGLVTANRKRGCVCSNPAAWPRWS